MNSEIPEDCTEDESTYGIVPMLEVMDARFVKLYVMDITTPDEYYVALKLNGSRYPEPVLDHRDRDKVISEAKELVDEEAMGGVIVYDKNDPEYAPPEEVYLTDEGKRRLTSVIERSMGFPIIAERMG